MTDLEMTKLCAQAMGVEIRIHDPTDAHEVAWIYRLPDDAFDGPGSKWEVYDPLNDDEQAMALVKRFMLVVDAFTGFAERGLEDTEDKCRCYSDESLNRAIVECVAKMQIAKL